MGWFFTGVWSTLLMISLVMSINKIDNGDVATAITFTVLFMVVTAFFIGVGIAKKD